MFLVTFCYIWGTAFYSDPDYYSNMPKNDSDAYHAVAQQNVWQALKSIVLFFCAFAYLEPYVETV